jgi:beta-glucosidase
VVLAVGEEAGMSGEASSRAYLDLPGSQSKLVEAIHATGKPVVVILSNGRPLTIGWIDKNIPAILETWFLGTQAGNAIADVLFGDYNPSGKLPVTFPRTVGQIPIFYSMKNTGRPMDVSNKYTSKYLDESNDPLYPFGYGLSYTTFVYGDIALSSAEMSGTDSLTVSCEVTNRGKLAGEEVVQLYIRDLVGSVTRPVKELKGFQKISLAPRESKTVSFRLSVNDLSFYKRDMTFGTEPGKFHVFIGGNSRDVKQAEFVLK